MKIPEKLESMVADLVSDERRQREEVEDLLGEIAGLVERFKDREPAEPALALRQTQVVGPTRPAVPPDDLGRQLENAITFNQKSGDDPQTAERKAKAMLNLD